MKPGELDGLDRDRAVERLTALWALNEAGLGGLIHAMRVPFTGIVVGSMAVVLITLIAYFAEHRMRALLRATVIVLLVKAAASPHTPLPAYAAVGFQGVVGALLFGAMSSVRAGGMLLGLLALWQGAVQKLLVMTILYGKPLWEAVDSVGHWILDKMGHGPGDLSPTGWFLVLYLGYYTIAGLLTGWLAGAIPGEIARALKAPRPSPEPPAELPVEPMGVAGKRWWRRTPFKTGLVLTALLGALMLLQPEREGWAKGVQVLARATVVLAAWMLVVRPLGLALFRRFRRREQGVYGGEVAQALAQFPALRQAAAVAWRRSQAVGGYRRGKVFLVELVVQALAGEGAGEGGKGDGGHSTVV